MGCGPRAQQAAAAVANALHSRPPPAAAVAERSPIMGHLGKEAHDIFAGLRSRAVAQERE